MVSIRTKLVMRSLSIAVLSGLLVFSVQAGDAAAGKKRATVCAGCHGNDGMAFIPNYPNLAGQNELYLIDALKAYRDGMRRHMQMTPMARGLSDTDIENLAAYYSGLTPKTKTTE